MLADHLQQLVLPFAEQIAAFAQLAAGVDLVLAEAGADSRPPSTRIWPGSKPFSPSMAFNSDWNCSAVAKSASPSPPRGAR